MKKLLSPAILSVSPRPARETLRCTQDDIWRQVSNGMW